MKTILVTGGAGFLGSHLCKRLLEAGDRVVCLDNFVTGAEANIEPLRRDGNFELVRHDITDPISLEKVDRIYNLACPASPIHYQRDPIKTVKASTIGMINVLELAARTAARVLQASTSEVYGDPEEHPQRESYWGHVNPIGPRSCYDEGKRVAETLCMDYHREKGVAVRLARIFNTYGPRMLPDDGRVVSNFIVQALKGAPITIYGDGSQTRSFCYVDDTVEGLIRLMNQEVITGPVNIGNPVEIPVSELARLIVAAVGSASRIEMRLLPQDDPRQRKPDITLARQSLGWEPKVPLGEGLARTVDYFRSLAAARG